MYNASSSSQIRNSIVWDNGSTAIVNSNDSEPAFSYSLIEGGVPSGAVDDGNNLATNPLFVTPISPASAPTTTGNLRLRAGSPAIDAGNNAVASPVLPATDRDGNPRIVGGVVNIGAYERLIFTVNLPLVRR